MKRCGLTDKADKTQTMKNLKTISRLYLAAIGLLAFSIPGGTLLLAGTYGYNLGGDSDCAVWWAEGAYKVMRYDPLPEGQVIPVRLKSARNEYESFQVVLKPRREIESLVISITDLKNNAGGSIPAAYITIREEVYVHIIRPTDDYGKPGWYPDPLPEPDGPLHLDSGLNHPFWITVKVPAAAKPGSYSGTIRLRADGWSRDIPLSLEVWNFSLPARTTIRSSFGISTGRLQQYHNTRTEEELKIVTDNYYRMMNDYRIAPTNPFELYPMKVKIGGLYWEGGLFSGDTVYAGKRALKITDHDTEGNTEAFSKGFIEIDPSGTYILSWHARTALPGQKYSLQLQCFDADKKQLLFENRMDVFTGSQSWKTDTLAIRPFRKAIKYVSIHLFPVIPDLSGCHTGTAWFDNIRLTAGDEENNLVPQGDFELQTPDLSVEVDFTAFDVAGEKYLDGLGFNAYHLPLQGLPHGNFYAQEKGVFSGFAQGTPEYDEMMRQYLTQVEEHLAEKGWLGKEYVYWFDEPNPENYPFVREGMKIIHRSAPGITRFITEHRPGSAIMDVTEISCTVIGRLDPEIISKLVKEGKEFWSYVCCCPKAPYLSLFIDHDAINMRMWLWLSYHYQLTGILVWSANYWNSQAASPKNYLQNPWEDPMSYTTGYGWPLGKQTGWGNGDGRFFYPPNRSPNDHSRTYLDGPVPSVRLEILRDGIEDYEYFMLLKKAVEQAGGKRNSAIKKAQKLLNLPPEILTGPTAYNKDPRYLILYRDRLGELLHTLLSEPERNLP